MQRIPVIVIAALLLSISRYSYAAVSSMQGAFLVRVNDSVTSRCINGATDKVYFNLRRVILNKEVGWFTEDKSAGVLLNTVIEGETRGTTEKVSFPRLFEARIEEFSSGRVAIPLEQMLLSGLRLSGPSHLYSSINIEFAILKKKKANPFGAALLALVDVKKQLPLPSNPYSEGFKFFAQYAANVVNMSLNDANNVDQQLREGSILFSFAPNGICTGDFEHTGTIAVVREWPGAENAGVVSIDQAGSYCWKSRIRPVFELRFAKPSTTTGTCSDVPEARFRTLANPYSAIFLNAVSTATGAAPVASERTIPSTTLAPTTLTQRQLLSELTSAGYSSQIASTLESKVHTALLEPLSKDRVPLGSIVEMSPEGDRIKLRTTRSDAAAYDVAEALARCAVHGIDKEKCFSSK